MRKPKNALVFIYKKRKWYGWRKRRWSVTRRKWVKVWTCKPADFPEYFPPIREWLGAIRAYREYRKLHGIHLDSKYT